VPRALRDFEDFCTMSERLARAAELPDYTYFSWKIRPHPRLGTVEVRTLDTQTTPNDAAALAALVEGSLPDAQGALRPVGAVLAEALALAAPHASELGCEDELEWLQRLVGDGGGAGRQRAVHAREGIDGLVRWLVRETAGTP
jgi:carboxylate-amine ligase